jgi:hypothetical protein
MSPSRFRGAAALLAVAVVGSALRASPQAGRQVKVVLEFQQKSLVAADVS